MFDDRSGAQRQRPPKSIVPVTARWHIRTAEGCSIFICTRRERHFIRSIREDAGRWDLVLEWLESRWALHLFFCPLFADFFLAMERKDIFLGGLVGFTHGREGGSMTLGGWTPGLLFCVWPCTAKSLRVLVLVSLSFEVCFLCGPAGCSMYRDALLFKNSSVYLVWR